MSLRTIQLNNMSARAHVDVYNLPFEAFDLECCSRASWFCSGRSWTTSNPKNRSTVVCKTNSCVGPLVELVGYMAVPHMQHIILIPFVTTLATMVLCCSKVKYVANKFHVVNVFRGFKITTFLLCVYIYVYILYIYIVWIYKHTHIYIYTCIQM